MKNLILITLIFQCTNIWAQSSPAPASSPPPVDIDLACRKARAQDEANKNNPAYSQSDISAQCAEINASKKGAKLENRLGKMRVISTTTCGVAAGLCYAGVTAKAGGILAKVCGGLGTALGTVDQVSQGMLDKELNKETGAFNAMSLFDMGKSLYGAKDTISEMGTAYENGKKPGKDENGDKKPSCGTIGKATAEEARSMATHFDSSNALSQAENDARKSLKDLVSKGGSFSMERFKDDKDDDGNLTADPESDVVDDLPAFPEDYASEFEDATGLNVDDIMNSDETPEELADAIANSLGLDSNTLKNAMASAGAPPLSSDILGRPTGETDGTSSASKMNASNGTFRAPDLSGLMKKLGERAPAEERKAKGKDFSKMTAAELEKDTKHNLFQRVSFRYEKEQSQLEKLMWASKLNAHANPKPLDTLSKRFPASKL